MAIRKIQAAAELLVERKKPIARNIRERERAVSVPQSAPQSIASRPLFFFIAIKPPKKLAEKIAKYERGGTSELGVSQSSDTAEKTSKRQIKIRIADTAPKSDGAIIPPLEIVLFF